MEEKIKLDDKIKTKRRRKKKRSYRKEENWFLCHHQRLNCRGLKTGKNLPKETELFLLTWVRKANTVQNFATAQFHYEDGTATREKLETETEIAAGTERLCRKGSFSSLFQRRMNSTTSIFTNSLRCRE